MNTCDTCKHWIKHGVIYYDKPPAAWGSCDNPAMEVKWLPGTFEGYPENTLVLRDSSDHGEIIEKYANLTFETGPKFGCIHHESI